MGSNMALGGFSQDVPGLDGGIVKEFFQSRGALILQERKQRSDYEFKNSLSSSARKAHDIVSQIRLDEQKSIWSTSRDSSLQSEELFPGMVFNSAKSHLENTKLFQIVQKMPKGALLHCHLAAMVDLDWVINEAMKTPGMYISSPSPLDTKEIREIVVVTLDFSTSISKDAPSIWSSEYPISTKVPLKEAAETFPDGGKEGFIAWMTNRCTITQTESVQHYLGIDDIWRKLQNGFVMVTSMVWYEPITRAFLQKFFETLVDDGVRWVEVRGMARKLRLEGQETLAENRLRIPQIFKEEIEKFKASEKGRKFWGCRLIWDCLRTFTREEIIKDVDFCIEAKKLYPEIISGYDLVGPEDDGRTLHDLTPEFLYLRTRCIAENLTIPFFLHAGECLGDGDSTDHNLYDAILLGSRRIGHAFSLYKHPLLIDMVKQKQILVECCPISNEVLRYCASIKSHPLPALLSRGVKSSLSNDDPALMGHGTSGLSHDFWQALQGWDNLGLGGLGDLARNSVRWSAFEDQTDEQWLEDVKEGDKGTGIRASRIKEWDQEWEFFCKWIVKEFGKS